MDALETVLAMIAEGAYYKCYQYFLIEEASATAGCGDSIDYCWFATMDNTIMVLPACAAAGIYYSKKAGCHMTLGEKIQILRRQRGMSQEILAARILVTRQAISKWELSESLPDVDNIVQLSEVFNVTTDYLLKNGANLNTVDTEVAAGATHSQAELENKVRHDAKSTGVAVGPIRRVLVSPMAAGVLGMVFVGLNILRRAHESALFPLAGMAIMVGIMIVFLPQPKIQGPTDTGLRLGKLMADAGIIAIIASGIFFSSSHARTILLYANIIAWVGLAIVGLCTVHNIFRVFKHPASFGEQTRRI